MRTVWVGSGPVSRTLTAPGPEESGTARTSDPTSISRRERSERSRFREPRRRLTREISVAAPATAMAPTAANNAMSCGGTTGRFRATFCPGADPAGSADTSVESGLSFPAVLTAVTMK